jgi:hypothetical protein
MVSVILWLQFLLVVLILRQSAAVSDQCTELQEEISRLERDIVRIIELKNESELKAANCHVSNYCYCYLDIYITISH